MIVTVAQMALAKFSPAPICHLTFHKVTTDEEVADMSNLPDCEIVWVIVIFHTYDHGPWDGP